MSGICGVAGCQEPKAKGKALCKEHRQEEERRARALRNGTSPTPEPRPADDGFMPMREESHMLDCDLTHEEVRERGIEQARCQGELDELARQRAQKLAELSAQHKGLDRRRGMLAHAIVTGREPRSVPVRLEANYKTGRVRVRRLDSGEVYHERALTDEERQARFGFDEDAP